MATPAGAVAAYNAGVGEAARNGGPCAGVARFLGTSVPGCDERAWEQNTNNKGNYWLEKYRISMTGGGGRG